MTTVVTCKIVKNGLRDPVMRKVATKIAEECTSTDRFKAKLTQIENFNQQTKPKKNKTHGICQEAHATITQYAIEKATLRGMREGRELQKTEKAIQQTTKRGSVERSERQKLQNQLECNISRQHTGNGHFGHTSKQCWYNTQSPNDNIPSCAWCEKHQAQTAHKGHTLEDCWQRADQKAKRDAHQICKGIAMHNKTNELRKAQNTTQLKKGKTEDFANGGWYQQKTHSPIRMVVQVNLT
jgi:hypothetical protein